MLYKKNATDKLSHELFLNPTAEYRGTPFWAWNCKLTKELLERQIDYMKEMGLGGFHMHSRTGMATDYLSDEFFSLVSACVEKAKKENMLAWLYDEDRWPSGAAGGIVTKDQQYSQRHLLLTTKPYDTDKPYVNTTARGTGRTENGKLLTAFDIVLSPDGTLKSYEQIPADAPAKGVKWYAYVEIQGKSPWFNNENYLNTLDKKSVDEFIRVTHEAYKNAVGKDFGETVPAIFTDEPQFATKRTLGFAAQETDVVLPWTDDLPDTYKNTYNSDIVAALPELLWELPDGKLSAARHHYHDHVAERFTAAFADNVGEWCDRNGILATGHMMAEETLHSQTTYIGDAMRAYRSFGLPGIDMLCDRHEFTTAKQAQSATRQYGKEGVMSELYGVTNWDYDFRGHKLQGDWQAALGVTVRVHHLTWVSMKGEAKRDYPASINYQSPWYKEYSYVEDHFARLNTALTRGKPSVRIGVVHPIESYWLHYGPDEQTSDIRAELDVKFHNLASWLVSGLVDFDYIAESLLPTQTVKTVNGFTVGEMTYDTVIVPACETLRKTTYDALCAFIKNGGNVIILGEAPTLIDAEPADTSALCNGSQHVVFGKQPLMNALAEYRDVEIQDERGIRKSNLMYQLREDNGSKWLFICHNTNPVNPDVIPAENITISLNGDWKPTLYDTMTGAVTPMHAVLYHNGKTVIQTTIYAHDSLLLFLSPGRAESTANPAQPSAAEKTVLNIDYVVPVTLDEQNVLMLDCAEYSLDGGEYYPVDELLRADNHIRRLLNYAKRDTSVAQPWVIKNTATPHTVSLRFEFTSELAVDGAMLALEDAESITVVFNGQPVANDVCGYFTDEDIKTIKLPSIKAGVNTLELTLPFGERANIEWCYILGDFGVTIRGREKIITAPVRTLGFGDITSQGLPFYGGNINYHIPIVTSRPIEITVRVPQYRGALVGVSLNDNRVGRIAYAPYECIVANVPTGKSALTLTLFGNRVNSFGAVHNFDNAVVWHGPQAWRSTGDAWAYEYNLKKTGILKTPDVYVRHLN